MAKRRGSRDFHRSLTYLFGFAFLLVSGVIGYKIYQSGSVLGTTNISLDNALSWEFNSTNKNDTEGWKGSRLSALQTIGGSLRAVTANDKEPGELRKSITNKPLYGMKYFSVRLSVSPDNEVSVYSTKKEILSDDKTVVVGDPSTAFGQVTPRQSTTDQSGFSTLPCRLLGAFPGPWCPSQKPTPTPTPCVIKLPPPCPNSQTKPCPLEAQRFPVTCVSPPSLVYSFPVEYTVAGPGRATSGKRSLAIQGTADGQMREYTVQLPETDAITIKDLQILFAGVPKKTKIDIDWIRIKGTGQITPSPTPSLGNKISWRTETVTLEADDFYIVANGKKYLGKIDPNTPPMVVRSDPGNANYTTLETWWMEGGVEMRLFLYFRADTANWWAYEIRTYDGVKYSPPISYSDWIYYYGPYFKSPLGTSLLVNGETNLTSAPSNKYEGKIYFKNLRLSVNFRKLYPSIFPTPTECKIGLNNFSVDTPCGGENYRYMTFSCYDGYGRKEGGPTSCKSYAVWKSNAYDSCAGRSSCPSPTTKSCPTPPVCKGQLIVGDPKDTSQCPVYQCSGGGVVCTQEAKLCPNGVYVSRTGPNCKFAPCPVFTQ